MHTLYYVMFCRGLVLAYFTHIPQGYITGTGIGPVAVELPWRTYMNISNWSSK